MGSKRIKRPWFRKPSLAVSRRMQSVKSKNTKLERAMESLLKAQGIRHQKQPLLFGRPDFRIKDTKILLFCDSSFWHGRRTKEITGKAFKKNREFWIDKLNYNRKRGARINRKLGKDGWRVLRFWDTDILKVPEKVTKRLLTEIEKDGE